MPTDETYIPSSSDEEEVDIDCEGNTDEVDMNIEQVLLDGDDDKGELQKYYENNSNFVAIKLKIPFLIGIRLTLGDDFNLDDDPYGHRIYAKRKKMFKPTLTSLLQEWNQRNKTQ